MTMMDSKKMMMLLLHFPQRVVTLNVVSVSSKPKPMD